MAKDYITYNEHLNKELKTIGFVRKNMNQFVRKQDDVIQYLFLGHHTNGEHFVRYYDISVQIAIPTIDVLEHEIGVTCGGFGCQIDYCNPEGSYDMYKWRIAKDDNPRIVQQVVSDMLINIIQYAEPFFRQHSTIKNILLAFERNKLSKMTRKRILPLLYIANGQNEKALDFMDRTLHELSLYTEEEDMKLRKGYVLPGYKHTTPWVNRDYINYMDYVSKCKAYIDGL